MQKHQQLDFWLLHNIRFTNIQILDTSATNFARKIILHIDKNNIFLKLGLPQNGLKLHECMYTHAEQFLYIAIEITQCKAYP